MSAESSISQTINIRQMAPRKQDKRFDERLAKEIGQRIRSIIGQESVSSFAGRLGINRQWLHEILSGLVPPSLETLSVMTDKLGYSLDWLRTGKGMPSAQWSEKTCLVARVAPKVEPRGRIKLTQVGQELVLVPNSLLDDFPADTSRLGVLSSAERDLGPLIGRLDEILLDIEDQELVNNGLFLAQVAKRLLVCRTFKSKPGWLLTSSDAVSPETLVKKYRVLGRIRLIWRRV